MSVRHARALDAAPMLRAALRTIHATPTGMTRDRELTPHIPLRVVRADVSPDQLPLQRDRDEFLLRVATKLSRLGGWSVDIPTRTVHWSDEVCALHDVVAGFVPTVEQGISFYAPEHREQIAALFTACATDGTPFNTALEIITAHGRRIWVRAIAEAVRDEAGRIVVVHGALQDITPQKAVERRLAQQAALLDAAHEAMLVQDMNDRIVYWNKGAERTFGWSAAESHERIASELFAIDGDEYRTAWSELLQRGAWEGEVMMVSRVGQRLSVDVRWTLVRNEWAEPVAVFAILSDVTERKRLEAQFLRAQRLDSLGTLAGGIAHDLNNVLAPILMSIEFLRDGVSDPSRLEMLRTIEASAERGAALVRQVLTFARGVEGRRASVDVGRLIREAQRILRTTFPKDIDIRLTCAPDLHAVSADPTQLEQLLMNLCVNARDAMPRGGVVSITLANVSLDKTYAGMTADAKPGRYVRLTVSDTGHGMSKAVQERLFEPFFTTKDVGRGTGLGLSTAHTIVKSHGGFMEVYSEIGLGAQFNVYLPALEHVVPERIASAFQLLPRGDGRTVLLVDDEGAIRTIVQQTLETYGYVVLLASDGAEALEVFFANREKIDVVLTDMAMPILDGPTMVAALHAIEPRLPVIGSSGLVARDAMQRARDAGMLDFVGKPYTAESLLVTLDRVLSPLHRRGGSPPA